MQQIDFKKFLPHLGILLFFYALTAVCFKDAVFGGKSLRQGDIIHYTGVSKEAKDYMKAGDPILWTGTPFAGMPTFQISASYPSNLISYLDKLTTKIIAHPSYNVFMYLAGFYLLMMVLGVNRYVAIMGSLAFAFSAYHFTILEAGHNSKAHTIAYMAPVLAGIILTLRGKFLSGFILSALFLALMLNANHLQMTYYLFILILLTGIAHLVDAVIKKQLPVFLKATGVLIVAATLAVGCNASLLWSTYDYGKYTIRGKSDLTIEPGGKKKTEETNGLDKEYALAWSYGTGETMTFLIPGFKGGSSTPMMEEHKELVKKTVEDPQMAEAAGNFGSYFGDMPFTSGPVYAGAITIFLLFMSFFLTEGPLKWGLITCCFLAIMLAWGRHYQGLTDFFFEYFPGYNKFRAVSSMMVLPELIIPILGALAVDRLVKAPGILKEKFFNAVENMKLFYVAFALTGGLALLVFLSPETFTDFSQAGETEKVIGQILQQSPQYKPEQITQYVNSVWPYVEQIREAIVKQDALRSFIFILLGAAIVFLYSRGVIKAMPLGIALSVLILVDMAGVSFRYLSSDDYVKKRDMENPFAVAPYYRPHAADQQILQDKGHYRVYNQLARLDQDAATPYFHKSLSGYHGAKLKRYQELIDFHLSQGNMAAFNMLNTKYFITRGMGEEGDVMAMPNPGALGNAWFVDEYRLVANADSEIMALNGFDPSKTAIVDQKFKDLLPASVTPDSLATATLTSYHPDKMIYDVNSTKGGIVVFSEIWYPSGWNAYIDGALQDHFCVNYVLRGLNVPAGKHTVEFRFEPSCYYTGEKISLASSVIMLLLFGGIGYITWKRRRPTVE